MKQFTLTLALIISVFISACSDDANNFSPVSPNMNITKDSESNIPEPNYSYLQTFSELEIKLWHVSNNIAEITLQNMSMDFEQLFAEITYADGRDLLFLERPDNSEFTIRLSTTDVIKEVKDIKIFVLITSPREALDFADNGRETSPTYPYAYLQSFNHMSNIEWKAYSSDLEIYVTNSDMQIKEAFVKLELKSGKMLVYVPSPNLRKFVLPNFASEGVIDVQLYCL